MSSTMLIADITVPERTRKDMGDLDGLARSIEALGLLEPIGVSSKGELCFGARRLSAAKTLGWTEIPVVVIDLANPLEAERDENTQRKEFTPSELVGMGRRIEERERRLAKLRQGARHDLTTSVSSDTEVVRGRRSDERAAASVGMSQAQYRRAKHVVEAAEKDPVTFQRLADAMDSGGSTIKGTYKTVREIEKAKEEVNGMSETATNGAAVMSKRERPLPGMQKRTGLKARVRLERIAMTLEGYADALPAMHTRGEDVGDVLDLIGVHARRVDSAVRRLKKEIGNGEQARP